MSNVAESVSGDALDEEEQEGAQAAAPPAKKLSGKALVLYIVVPSLLAVATMLGIGYFTGMIGGKKGGNAQVTDEGPVVYYDLPEMLITLSGDETKINYLKIRVSLELADAAATGRLDEVMPRIIDNFQVYLRELRLSDLNGSAGLYRLKEELLRRVNMAAAPARVRDVLFKEMLVQ